MEKNSQLSLWPEIVFGSFDSKKSQAIRRVMNYLLMCSAYTQSKEFPRSQRELLFKFSFY